MKILLSVGVFLLLFQNTAQTQELQVSDTTYINFYIASGEFGGRNEGLQIYPSDGELKAKYVRYYISSYGLPLVDEKIYGFYQFAKDNYRVLKPEWVLSAEEKSYISSLMEAIRSYKPEGFSNAFEHYVILSNSQFFVLKDMAGSWGKNREVRVYLGLDKERKKSKKSR